jgi:hypothetical protein
MSTGAVKTCSEVDPPIAAPQNAPRGSSAVAPALLARKRQSSNAPSSELPAGLRSSSCRSEGRQCPDPRADHAGMRCGHCPHHEDFAGSNWRRPWGWQRAIASCRCHPETANARSTSAIPHSVQHVARSVRDPENGREVLNAAETKAGRGELKAGRLRNLLGHPNPTTQARYKLDEVVPTRGVLPASAGSPALSRRSSMERGFS